MPTPPADSEVVLADMANRIIHNRNKYQHATYNTLRFPEAKCDDSPSVVTSHGTALFLSKRCPPLTHNRVISWQDSACDVQPSRLLTNFYNASYSPEFDVRQ
jgi:hypothetical protein